MLIKIRQSETTTTTTQFWTPVIVLTSITALLILRKRMKPKKANIFPYILILALLTFD
ncbi:MAG: hypothetical protein ACFFAJ_10510 [Candidatus Hodarchaeota archaeon]